MDNLEGDIDVHLQEDFPTAFEDLITVNTEQRVFDLVEETFTLQQVVIDGIAQWRQECRPLGNTLRDRFQQRMIMVADITTFEAFIIGMTLNTLFGRFFNNIEEMGTQFAILQHYVRPILRRWYGRALDDFFSDQL